MSLLTWSMVRGSANAISGSTECTAFSMLRVMSVGSPAVSTPKSARRPGNLPEGNLDLRPSVAQAAAADVVKYAYDLPRDCRSELGYAGNQFLNYQPLLERVFVREVFLDEAFAYHCHSQARGVVLVCEGPSAQHLNAEGLEVIGRDHPEGCGRPLRRVRKLRRAGDGERHAKAWAFERQTG
jgi:hypothetical protein